jgi:ubiquinol-cytochrome c reductase subunit 7
MSHNRATIAFVKKLTELGRIKPLKESTAMNTIKKFSFDNAKFNQFGESIIIYSTGSFSFFGVELCPLLCLKGLFHDDMLFENENVKEALRRIPKDVYHERMYRFNRALMLSSKKDILPKDNWTTWENDLKYLSPYVEDIENEKREIQNWENENVNI